MHVFVHGKVPVPFLQNTFHMCLVSPGIGTLSLPLVLHKYLECILGTFLHGLICLPFVVQKELIDLAASEATCAAQVTFCESLLERVKRGESMLLCPTAGKHGSHSQAKVTIPGACAACGLGFVASEVVCVYTLACGDAYHALCFAGWAGSERVCANPSCKQNVPESAKSMLLYDGWFSILHVHLN